jgi:hypothetical protein
MKKILLSLAIIAGLFVSNASVACEACGKGDPAVEFRGAMQKLWADHMQWTYATVDAFYHNQNGLKAQLDRLLKNQKDIGAAIVPVYGQAAGDKLAELLTIHINQAVPVLTAAKNGDQAALKKALDDWHVNAQEIADFLANANPKNWKQADLREMMKKHIDTTTAYAVELLKGNYEEAVKKFDEANDHMKQMSDELAMGIIKQFPDKFKKTETKTDIKKKK